MGGVKKSYLEIKRERAERLRLTREIATMHSQVRQLKAAITHSLASATAGIRSTFSAEVVSAQKWQEQVDAVAVPLGMQNSDLQAQHASLASLLAGGEQALGQILLCFTRKGDQMAGEVAKQLVAVRTLMAKHRASCGRWFAQNVQDWESTVDRASQLHDDEDYSEAGKLLDAVAASIHARAEEAAELTKQQQTRTYLLKAVRQVCCNMGLKEVTAPRLERADDPLSRILLTVASPDKGQLRLALSLDGIQTVGEAKDCKQDLRQFSELLSGGFGIQTRFQGVTDDDPQLTTAGRRTRPNQVDEATHMRG